MNKSDLLALANLLDTKVPEKRFDMSLWAGNYDMADSHTHDSERSVYYGREAKKHRFHQAFKRAEQQDHPTFGDGRQPTVVEPECGMVACAGGWAATIPEFRARGLRLIDLDRDENDRNASTDVMGKVLPRWFGTDYAVVSFEGYNGYPALARFFDISQQDAFYLFNPGNYDVKEQIDPHAVAQRIRAYAASGGVVSKPVAREPAE
jgi:hypothetical protein